MFVVMSDSLLHGNSSSSSSSTVVYLHDMKTNIITREVSQKNDANNVLKEVENL